jgi:hypothetical protein
MSNRNAIGKEEASDRAVEFFRKAKRKEGVLISIRLDPSDRKVWLAEFVYPGKNDGFDPIMVLINRTSGECPFFKSM